MTTPTTPTAATRAAIALGSNLGDSLATLEGALRALAAATAIDLLACSCWYRSLAIGPAQPDYLNGCCLIRTTLAAEALLEELLRIERAFGRVRGERWGPRTLDLDLLLFGDLQRQEPILTVPHPHMLERPFVLTPLAEIAADWREPRSGHTIGELAARLGPGGLLERRPRPAGPPSMPALERGQPWAS
jgi:2-amino-4-hydroxy-6-hydroxymethyldihydropteridine diphosphokinase